MKAKRVQLPLILLLNIIFAASAAVCLAETKDKLTPDAVLSILKDGNQRFSTGQPQHPNIGPDRLALAAKSDQADYALATVLACSDSRVPVELLFDAGVMDLFVVRVAGNVCQTDEIGSIEYGLLHVKTPVLVILGHTHCGAVTAVTQEVLGNHHDLERNIPPLIAPIFPAVKEAMSKAAITDEEALVERAIEANVWQSMYDLFLQSPAVRKQVKDGKVKVVGAIYDLGTGAVKWFPETESAAVLARAEAAPDRITDAMACNLTETTKPPAAVHKTAPVLAQSTAALGQSNGLPGYLESIQTEVKTLRTDVGAMNTGLTAGLKALEDKLAKAPETPAQGAPDAIKNLGDGFERQLGDIKKSIASGFQDLRGDVGALNKSVGDNLEKINRDLSSGLNSLGEKAGQNQNQALQDTVRGVGEGINQQVGDLRLIVIIGVIVLGVLVAIMAFMLRHLILVRLEDIIARHESLRTKTRQALIGMQKQIR